MKVAWVKGVIGFALAGFVALAGFACAQLNRDEQLFGAAQQGDVAQMKLLIEQGANVNARFDSTTPVLVAAIDSANAEAVRLLLDHGADPNIDDGWQHKTATRLSKPHPAIRAMLLKAGGHD